VGLVVVVGTASFVSSALASSGWAGSRYAESDCRQISVRGRPGLYCERTFSLTRAAAQSTLVADQSCLSGLRAVERQGTLRTIYVGFDIYAGPLPLRRFNTGGDNVGYIDSWLSFTDADVGCT